MEIRLGRLKKFWLSSTIQRIKLSHPLDIIWEKRCRGARWELILWKLQIEVLIFPRIPRISIDIGWFPHLAA
jgi:hypothetical protein